MPQELIMKRTVQPECYKTCPGTDTKNTLLGQGTGKCSWCCPGCWSNLHPCSGYSSSKGYFLGDQYQIGSIHSIRVIRWKIVQLKIVWDCINVD